MRSTTTLRFSHFTISTQTHKILTYVGAESEPGFMQRVDPYFLLLSEYTTPTHAQYLSFFVRVGLLWS